MAIDQTTEQEQTRTYTHDVTEATRDFVRQVDSVYRASGDDAPPARRPRAAC